MSEVFAQGGERVCGVDVVVDDQDAQFAWGQLLGPNRFFAIAGMVANATARR
jgi:hypothetical protein